MVLYMETLLTDLAHKLVSDLEAPTECIIEISGEAYLLTVKLDKYEGKSYRDRDWLVTNYINNNRTMNDIATSCGVTPATINQWLVRFEIPTRGRGRRS